MHLDARDPLSTEAQTAPAASSVLESQLPLRIGRLSDEDDAPSPASASVLDPLAFRRCVQQERMRADRLGDKFALLMIRLTGPAARGRRAAYDVGGEMLGHVRDGDVVGLRGRNTVGILLHDCPADQAKRLGDRVCGDLKERGFGPVCRVVAYADDGADRLRLKRMLHRPSPPWKRVLDVAVAGPALLAALPVMGVIAAGIKLTDPGPILFNQKRASLGGRPFHIHKFRTMIVDAEAKKAQLRAISEQDGPAFKLKRDPRVTRFGSFLRKTSLDELPQLWNIVKGDMSLVGPRPLPVDEQAGCSRWQAARLDVAPGLTCHWQVEGRSRVSFEEWMRMDLRYLNGRGLWKDIKIIAATIPAVLFRRGSV